MYAFAGKLSYYSKTLSVLTFIEYFMHSYAQENDFLPPRKNTIESLNNCLASKGVYEVKKGLKARIEKANKYRNLFAHHFMTDEDDEGLLDRITPQKFYEECIDISHDLFDCLRQHKKFLREAAQ